MPQAAGKMVVGARGWGRLTWECRVPWVGVFKTRLWGSELAYAVRKDENLVLSDGGTTGVGVQRWELSHR